MQLFIFFLTAEFKFVRRSRVQLDIGKKENSLAGLYALKFHLWASHIAQVNTALAFS